LGGKLEGHREYSQWEGEEGKRERKGERAPSPGGKRRLQKKSRTDSPTCEVQPLGKEKGRGEEWPLGGKKEEWMGLTRSKAYN